MNLSGGQPSPRSRAFIGWTLRWGKWLWALALVLAVPATWRTAELYAHLRSEMEQLLPRSAPSVAAIDELRARLPGLQHLGVIVDTGSAENLPAGERFLDDLAVRLRAYPPDLVKSVRIGDAVERRFVEDHAPLYMDLEDLETVRRRIEARRDWEASKETGALLDEEDSPPSLDLDDIKKKYDERSRSAGHFDDDRYASRALHTAVLLVEVGEFETGRGRSKELLDRVKADVDALHVDRYAPGMRVGFTGDVAINVEETSALVADLSLSSVMVAVLVATVIVIYYRWWRSIVVLLPPLLLATVYSFAVASLPPFGVTELNSNTAFLGSIIVGNGINFGIVLLARFVDERRSGASVRDALDLAVWGARIGTLSAALAAGVSYASLALTRLPRVPPVRDDRRTRHALLVGAGLRPRAAARRLAGLADHDAASPLPDEGGGGVREPSQPGRRLDVGGARARRGVAGSFVRTRPDRDGLLEAPPRRHLEERRGLLGSKDGRAARHVRDADRDPRG